MPHDSATTTDRRYGYIIFTRSVRGWELGRDLSASLMLTALERALKKRQPSIHHSDQGVQYAATTYVERLQVAGVLIRL